MKNWTGRKISRIARRSAIVTWLLAGLAACGSSKQPASSPDPSLDSPSGGGETTPASSAKVKQGMEAIQSEDFATAKAVLTEAQQSDPNDPQAAYYLGVAHEGLGETDQARDQYEKALQLDANLVEAAVNLSGLLLDADQGEEALKVVQAALAKAPDDKNLLLNHALALEATGDLAGATTAYAKAVEKAPDDAALRVSYIQLLAGQEKNEEAKAQIGKLGKVSDKELARALAQVELKLGMLGECISLLDGIAAKDPTPDVHMSRAACKYAKKDNAGAEADYRAAIALDPNFAPGHFYLGVLLAKEGKKQEAIKSLQKAAETGKGTPAEEAAKKEMAKLK